MSEITMSTFVMALYSEGKGKVIQHEDMWVFHGYPVLQVGATGIGGGE
jgi:hypothetical protein